MNKIKILLVLSVTLAFYADTSTANYAANLPTSYNTSKTVPLDTQSLQLIERRLNRLTNTFSKQVKELNAQIVSIDFSQYIDNTPLLDEELQYLELQINNQNMLEEALSNLSQICIENGKVKPLVVNFSDQDISNNYLFYLTDLPYPNDIDLFRALTKDKEKLFSIKSQSSKFLENLQKQLRILKRKVLQMKLPVISTDPTEYDNEEEYENLVNERTELSQGKAKIIKRINNLLSRATKTTFQQETLQQAATYIPDETNTTALTTSTLPKTPEKDTELENNTKIFETSLKEDKTTLQNIEEKLNIASNTLYYELQKLYNDLLKIRDSFYNRSLYPTLDFQFPSLKDKQTTLSKIIEELITNLHEIKIFLIRNVSNINNVNSSVSSNLYDPYFSGTPKEIYVNSLKNDYQKLKNIQEKARTLTANFITTIKTIEQEINKMSLYSMTKYPLNKNLDHKRLDLIDEREKIITTLSNIYISLSTKQDFILSYYYSEDYSTPEDNSSSYNNTTNSVPTTNTTLANNYANYIAKEAALFETNNNRTNSSSNTTTNTSSTLPPQYSTSNLNTPKIGTEKSIELPD